jgi:hypothetical protein
MGGIKMSYINFSVSTTWCGMCERPTQKSEDDLRINSKKYKHLKILVLKYFVMRKLERPTQRSDNIKMKLKK